MADEFSNAVRYRQGIAPSDKPSNRHISSVFRVAALNGFVLLLGAAGCSSAIDGAISEGLQEWWRNVLGHHVAVRGSIMGRERAVCVQHLPRIDANAPDAAAQRAAIETTIRERLPKQHRFDTDAVLTIGGDCVDLGEGSGLVQWTALSEEHVRHLHDWGGVRLSYPAGGPGQLRVCVRDPGCGGGAQLEITLNGEAVVEIERAEPELCRTLNVPIGRHYLGLKVLRDADDIFGPNCLPPDRGLGRIVLHGADREEAQDYRIDPGKTTYGLLDVHP